MQSSRPDIKTAEVVDLGIHMISTDGRRAAAIFMSARGIGFRTLVRTIAGVHRVVLPANVDHGQVPAP